MNQNPKFVDPKLWPNPDKLKFAEFYKYEGLDMARIRDSFKNYKASKFYLLGIFGGCYMLSMFIDKAVNKYTFGENGNGGDILKMYSLNSNYDFYYNRQFQQMRYLTEDLHGDDSLEKARPEHLISLGIAELPVPPNNIVRKKAPHEKYL
ncbi:hypothetical protein IMG5_206925 [Ichthyophthirius multifiliis]|uniref:Uncharacterized protein n=1 Tax=Ichthyophthirius multifiliis TaxID=5932 RepID=G0R1Q8_ICHMU|nr:hypothetical protein IMG5_206925 [Ichthyophthirius multifiliis]EGR28603.1 hypothetical protein IMG5_206925 [Ichthyophthirius multifiliis]|eukprot:XP_004029839.1 hypothetical protein IMG5_206925 [Ichthyophthirius multifiliis]